MEDEHLQEKLILQFTLTSLMWYELVALQTRKVPTITRLLKSCPKYGSAAILGSIALAMVDHIYFQKVFP